ncbi:ankyrin repeat domain-containing protein 11 [Drosophila sechellia]|uniref:ankyrin repeat domain-containing protein 11 n=1 Tax=Drosophila sechellia TaxID=7238 RepID=UPI0013DE30ED|nr:ankyrin repeat domain-containing protein 11 [Drosophila sechellia]
MAASSAAAAAPTNPISLPTDSISEECKDDDALTSTLHTCANDPDFAVICAFLQKFAKDLGLSLPNFKHLQEWLTNNNEVPELRDLHIKLLRKTRKTVHEKSWESALSKFCFGYSVQDAWEIERFGYKNSSLKVKLRIFRELLESQFERNAKFRAHILTLNADTLRSEPIGRDRLGHAYWLTQDAHCNLRIYQEHLDEEIWQVVATNRDEFVNLISRLRGNEVVLPSKDIGEADEDTSSSNSCPPKPPPPEQKEEEDEEEVGDEPVKTVPNLKIKLRSPDQEDQKSKKVKPLLISQAKLSSSASPAPTKKRSIEDVDSSPTASQEEQQKKHRPTLLDTKRIKKPSRYESTNDEIEEESGEEDEEEEDEEDSELDEGEEEEDVDSAAADIEEDDDEEDTGEPIEDPTIVVQGQGSGLDCEAIPYNFIGNLDYGDDLEIGEAIADPMLHVIGQGWGTDCLVGNGKNEASVEETSTHTSEPKATFFFGEPGCLKLSPMKQTSKPEVKRSIFDSLSEEKTNGESEKCIENTPPRNGSELTKTLGDSEDTASAGAATLEETNICQEAKVNIISDDQIKKKESELVAKRNIQDSTISVIEKNEEISKGRTESEAIEEGVKNRTNEVSVLQNNTNESDNSSIQTQDQHLIPAELKKTKEPVTEECVLESVTAEDKLLRNHQQISKRGLDTASNEKLSCEAQSPVPNDSQMKSEQETATSAKSSSTDGEDETAKSKCLIDPYAGKSNDKCIIMNKIDMAEGVNETLIQDDSPKDISRSETNTTCLEINISPSAEHRISEKMQAIGASTSQSLHFEDNGKSREVDGKSRTSGAGEEISKPSTLLNRKRRLNDSQSALRNSTSESEVQEEEQQDDDPTLDDLDVGGKRIKMRPKTANAESRRKVESQKTQLEETTSSSGEDDARIRRKCIAPHTKTKPTLEEIIERKLKKSIDIDLPEKTTGKVMEKPKQRIQQTREATPPISSLSSQKKTPITKPLKKNLLTQLRQEDSEEEPIPRKRTNSETLVPAIPASNVICQADERHRKRRSSEDANEAFSKESSPTEVAPSAVSEKLKRNNEQDIQEEVEDPLAMSVKDSLPSVKDQSPVPEGCARRSGRRGGAAVIHSELPQPKRTRGGARDKMQPEVNAELKQESEDDEKIAGKIKSEAKDDPAPEIPENRKKPEEKPIKEKPNEEPKPKVGRGRGPRKKREVDTTNIIESNDSETPVRQSRRIAQQKIKEEAERRKQEEVALRSMKQELKKKKKAEKEADPTVLEPSGEESESEASEAEEEARNKKKKKCPGKDGWSSDSEEQPESEEEEEEPPHYETDPGSPLFRSDHEFSPESELEDESQVVPMKRARTVRKENADDLEEDAEEACQKCGKSDHPEWILLCDTPTCNKGYHCSCLSPVLFYIPEGDWHCPPCQQEQLIAALERQLEQYDTLVAQKQQERILAEEQAERERQELEAATLAAKDENFKSEKEEDEDDRDDMSVGKVEKVKRRRGDGRINRRAAKRGTRRRRGNESDSSHGKSLRSGSRSGSGSESSSDNSTSFSDSDDEPIYKLRKRRQINVSYRLNEYDDLINSALKKEMDEVAGAGNLGRGKDISTIIEADKEKARRDDLPTEGEVENKEDGEKEKHKSKSSGSSPSSSEDEVPLKRSNKFKQPPAKKKARKLTTLDVSSEEDNGSDEDFKTSSYSDEDTSQSASGDSDSSLEVYRRPGRGKKQRKAARRAARERRKDRKFVVEESDESEDEDQKRRITKSKKKKDDSDYTETETEDDDDNELSDNVDSADLCDDTTSESEDGAWNPSSKKKKTVAAKKSNSSGGIARKSPKLKKLATQAGKKVKRLEYSDDDISESDLGEDDDDDDEDEAGAPLSGKGSGKQPRSQPLKPSASSTLPGKGKGKGKAKKKKPMSSEEEDGAASDDRTRTRGRRYAYIEDDDDSSDGGIKPGVHRPDTPPEERQKFIQRQEEIKRMLAEKNAEGAKIAATPRLTPLKSGVTASEKRTPGKAAGSDSLSTVPLSVIRQAKVLDIDYLQRKGETIGDLDDVDESELDDAELPDDLPEDMEDAIARMVEEEEQFSAAVAARELPGAEEVLRTTPSKTKQTSRVIPESPAQNSAPSTSGLQEPHRKRLPMPTMHPPLLRHQFPISAGPSHSPASLVPPHAAHGMHPMLQRHLSQTVPPPQAMHLLQNALSAPLGQPLGCGNYGSGPNSTQHLPLVMSMPSAAAAAAHLMQSAVASATARPFETASGNPAPDPKPRGRRKKVTPLRDQLQKQQTAAAVTAATSTTPGSAPSDKEKAQPLFKPHDDAAPSAPASQASVITRMPSHLPPAHGRSHGPPGGVYPSSAELARFYGQVANQQPIPAVPGSRSPSSTSGPPRHLLRPQMPAGLPPPHASLRPTYGPPPPLRGSGPPTSTPSTTSNSRPGYLHGAEHHGGPSGSPMGGIFNSGPPPARHASPHLNPYRAPPIYGNPNYSPRLGGAPGTGGMRPGAVDYVTGPRGYSPYGYYPPPLSTPSAHAATSSVIVSAPHTLTPTNHSVSTLTHGKTPQPTPTQSSGPPPAAAPPPTITSETSSHKPPMASVITSKKLTTLEAYPIRKSPNAVVAEVSGPAEPARSPAPIAEEDSGSAHDTRAPPSATGTAVVGEFSGLVSYFSSQQDDYDT